MKKLFLLLLLSLALLCSCGQNAPIDAESTTAPTTEAAPTSAATIVTEPLVPVVEPTLHTVSFIAAGDNMA